jgi:EmrB/QacA subfamily drug resistance transporter
LFDSTPLSGLRDDGGTRRSPNSNSSCAAPNTKPPVSDRPLRAADNLIFRRDSIGEDHSGTRAVARVDRRGDHRVTFVVLAVGASAFALLQSLVIPVLTTIQHEFSTTQTTATWVLTAYLVSASVFTPIMGRIGDMIGKERVFVATLVALSLGSLLAALAGSIGVLIAARVVQGVGGGVLPLAFGIIRDEFPAAKVVGAVGSIATLTAVGGSAGTVLAGPINDSLGFRWLFWIPMIVTIAAAGAAAVFVPESPVRSPGRFALPPVVLLSGWLVAVLIALSEAPLWGWGSARVLTLLAGGVVLAGGWVLAELRSNVPLIDMRMMRQKAVWTTNLVALLVGAGMYGTFAFLPELLQTPTASGYGFGASITESGLILLPSGVTMFLVGQYSGSLTRRFGGRALVLAGSLIAAASMALIAFAHDSKAGIYLASAVMGVGIGLAFSAMSALVVAAVPPEQTGVASGMNANIRTIGGSIGAAMMASIVTARLEPSGLPRESGYVIGFATLAAILVFAAVAALRIPTGQQPIGREDAPHAEAAIVAGATVVGYESE